MDSIGIILDGLYIGGAEKIAINLANKFVSAGNPTYIFIFENSDGHYQKEIDKRIEIIYLPRRSKFSFILKKIFYSEINKRKINKIIFFCLTPLFLSRLFSFKRNKSISYYITLHSTNPVNLKVYLKTLFILSFARKTDRIIYVCNNQRLYYKSNYFFSPPLYNVIYNGVDIDYFKPGNVGQPNNLKESMNIPQNNKIILLVATFRPEKGHVYAIEALNILHTKYPDKKNTNLVFIGGGQNEYISYLKQLTEKYSLQQFVHFGGVQEDVRPYYEIADIFTLTSQSVETFSIAALEAMCYGLPISLTNIGGASEMIFEGKNGLLSNLKDSGSIADSWASLLDAGLKKESIREIVVKNFSLESVFKNYQKAISL